MCSGGADITTAKMNQAIARMARGKLVVLGVKAAIKTNSRQNKAAKRRVQKALRILYKSYAEWFPVHATFLVHRVYRTGRPL
jgi:hypothetical protein